MLQSIMGRGHVGKCPSLQTCIFSGVLGLVVAGGTWYSCLNLFFLEYARKCSFRRGGGGSEREREGERDRTEREREMDRRERERERERETERERNREREKQIG